MNLEGALLKVNPFLVMDTQKARFDVQGGRVFFDYPAPRVCDDAFFHVAFSVMSDVTLVAKS